MQAEKTYRYLTALVFAILMIAENFSCIFIVADYYANINAYAARCINKDKPQMHCNGKCRLSKKLQQENKKDQDNTETKPGGQTEIAVFSKFHAPSLPPVPVADINNNKQVFISCYHPLNCSSDIFHPPQA